MKFLNLQKKNKMWIITRDADFQNIQKFNNYQVAGIILIKLTLSKTGSLLKTIKRFLDKYNDKLSEKRLIIEDYEVRIYQLERR